MFNQTNFNSGMNFNQKPNNVIALPSNTNTFGQNPSPFGQQPNQGTNQMNTSIGVFGNNQTQSNNQNPNAFGNSQNNTWGNNQTNQNTFGQGTFGSNLTGTFNSQNKPQVNTFNTQSISQNKPFSTGQTGLGFSSNNQNNNVFGSSSNQFGNTQNTFGNTQQNNFGNTNSNAFGNTQSNTFGNNQTNNGFTSFGNKPSTTIGNTTFGNTNSFGNNQFSQITKPTFGQTQGTMGQFGTNQTNQNQQQFGQTNNAFGNNNQTNTFNSNQFGQMNNTTGQNNNAFGQNNNTFGQNKPQTQISTFGTNNNTFGQSNQNQTNTFGQSTNNFGQTSTFGQNTFGQSSNSPFGQNTNNLGQNSLGQNTNTFGQNTFGQNTFGQPQSVNQGQTQTNKLSSVNVILPQGLKNGKQQFINSITYMSQMNGTNLSLLRLNDYNLMRENQLPQQFKDTFNNYLQQVGNNKVTSNNTQNLNIGGIFSGSQNTTQTNTFGNPQPSSNMLQSNVINNQSSLNFNSQKTPTFGNTSTLGQNNNDFGNQAKQGGLFGTTTPSLNTQSGMFGQTQGLLGNTQTQQNSGGLFGNTTSQIGTFGVSNQSTMNTSSNTGLFGTTNSNMNGLFNTTNSNNNFLMGGNTTSQIGQKTDLFNTTPQSGGLFNTQSQGGLFNTSQNAQTQPTTLFNTQPQQSNPNALNFTSNLQTIPLSQNHMSNVTSEIFSHMDKNQQPFVLYYLPVQDSVQQQEILNPKNFSLQLDNKLNKFQDNYYQPVKKQPLQTYNNIIIRSHNNSSLLRKYEQSKKSLSEKFQESKREVLKSKRQLEEPTIVLQKPKKAEFFIDVVLDTGSEKNFKIKMKMDRKKMIAHILKNLIDQNWIAQDQTQNCQIFHNNQPIQHFYDFADYPEIVNNSQILVKLSEQPIVQKIFASKEILPKIGQKLKTQPSYQELARMTELQLSSVQNFTAYNEFGSVKFIHPVDLRKLDLSKIIKIDLKKIEIYPSSEFSEDEKPEQGSELNKPAYLTFNNLKPDNNTSVKSYMKKIQNMIQTMNAEMIHYDPVESNLKIRVEHFQLIQIMQFEINSQNELRLQFEIDLSTQQILHLLFFFTTLSYNIFDALRSQGLQTASQEKSRSLI